MFQHQYWFFVFLCEIHFTYDSVYCVPTSIIISIKYTIYDIPSICTTVNLFS